MSFSMYKKLNVMRMSQSMMTFNQKDEQDIENTIYDVIWM